MFFAMAQDDHVNCLNCTALFAGLNKQGSGSGPVSENDASFLNKHVLHKCNSDDLSPEVPADSPAEVLYASLQCFAMTFDYDMDELTGWLHGVSGDRWPDQPRKDKLISFAHNAYTQGHCAKLPGSQDGEDESSSPPTIAPSCASFASRRSRSRCVTAKRFRTISWHCV